MDNEKVKRTGGRLFPAACVLLVLVLAFSLVPMVFAAESGAVSDGQSFSIPITVSIVKTTKSIDVTLPAALPISVLDGKVLTADNLSIQNHSNTTGVRVTGISVEDGKFRVASFAHFPEDENGRIALRINGCAPVKAGPLSISDTAFPLLEPGGHLPIRYDAKVSATANLNHGGNINAASVIITLRAE